MITLTYRIETSASIEALAAKIASDQSTGTFVALAGGSRRASWRYGLCRTPIAHPFPKPATGPSSVRMSTSRFRWVP
jgi:ribulose-bisphosphate carboxylase large chain